MIYNNLLSSEGSIDSSDSTISTPNSLKALMKFEPLSVIVATILSLFNPNSVCTSNKSSATLSYECVPLNRLHASTAPSR